MLFSPVFFCEPALRFTHRMQKNKPETCLLLLKTL